MKPQTHSPQLTVPVLGFCAASSGMGKTTLLVALLPALQRRGLRVSVVKHAHHAFDIDHPGKDSYRLREAGAVQMLIGSSRRWALMTELDPIAGGRVEPDLAELVNELDPSLADLILVEGFKQAMIPKIEVHRPALGRPLLAHEDVNIIAIACDGLIDAKVPVLALNDPEKVADFVANWLVERVASAGEPV